MALTLTPSYVEHGEIAYAQRHKEMLRALDELLYARYNGCSWLAFKSQTTPQISLGDVFTFGTVTNLRTDGAIAYNISNETIASASLIEATWNVASHVLFVNNTLVPTLNRKNNILTGPGEVTPSTYWLGSGGTPEQFKRLRTADLLIQNYTDPVAGDIYHFTYKVHWNKYGCVRIHNGNRFALSAAFHTDSTQSLVIPPYGVVALKRLHQTGSFVIDSSYIHTTDIGDRMSYQANETGQSAACMEEAYAIMQQNGWLRYNAAEPDYDTTSRETASFTGGNPALTDKVFDWINHRGHFLSVLWDKNTNQVTKAALTWQGIDTGFGTNDYVQFTKYAGTYVFTSKAQAMLGHSNFEHDLIPISCNLTGAEIMQLRYGKTYSGLPLVWWNHLQNPLSYGTIVDTGVNQITTPYYPPTDYQYTVHSFDDVPRTTAAPTYVSTLVQLFPNQTSASTYSTLNDTFLKTNAAIGRHIQLAVSGSGYNYAKFSSELLNNCKVESPSKLAWNLVSSYNKGNGRARFVSFATRKYLDRYGELDINNLAHFTYHPQDAEVQGSLDTSGSQPRMDVLPLEQTDIQIEGSDFTRTTSDYGMDVYLPTTNIYYILQNINSDGWWQANRANVVSISEQQKLISWRLPRLIEHLNDLVKAINNVAEVYPVDITSLYKDPLPVNAFEKPYSIGGENGFAVPSTWIAGRYDQNNSLKTWANTWGIAYETTLPNMAELRNAERYLWCERQTYLPVGEYYWGPIYSNEFAEWQLKYCLDYSPSYNNTVKLLGAGGEVIDSYRQSKAWYFTYSRKLFGGAGSDNQYAWISYNAANAVFAPLNLVVPRIPIGERFTPKHKTDTGLTKLSGDAHPDYDDGLPPHWREVMDAFMFYNVPNSSGTWIKTVSDAEEFRLVELTTTSKRRKYQPQRKLQSGEVYQWLVHEFDEDAETIEEHERSGRYLAPQTGSAGTYGPKVDTPAYKTLTEIYCSDGVLLACGPEPYFTHQYDTIEYPPIYQPESFNVTQPVGSLFFKEVAAIDMPITVTKIQAWSGQTWPVWHCQIIRRKGTMRT